MRSINKTPVRKFTTDENNESMSVRRNRKSPVRVSFEEKIEESVIENLDKWLYFLSNSSNLNSENLTTASKGLHNIEKMLIESLDNDLFTANEHTKIVVESLSNISFQKMVAGINENYHSAQYMETVSHYLRHLIKAINTVNNGTEIMSSLLKDSTVIGEGAYGEVSSVKLVHTSELFALKANKNIKDDLLHEAVVGLYCLNKLRNKTPVFAYTYAGIQCAGTYMNDESSELIWCNNKYNTDNYNFLWLEHINNAKSLETEIINGLSGAEFLELYKQVIGGLEIAFEEYGYEHKDLHTENVLVQRSNKPLKVFTGNNEYIFTQSQARIIDYGLSSFNFLGKRLFVPGMPEEVIPLGDAYKLLLFSAESAYRSGNNDVFSVIEDIYRFFENQYSLSDRVLMRIESVDSGIFEDYYVYEPISKYEQNYRDLLNFLELPKTSKIIRGGITGNVSTNLSKLILENQKSNELNSNPMLYLLQKEYLGEKAVVAVNSEQLMFNILEFQQHIPIIESQDFFIYFRYVKTAFCYHLAGKYLDNTDSKFKHKNNDFLAKLNKYLLDLILKFEENLLVKKEPFRVEFNKFIKGM